MERESEGDRGGEIDTENGRDSEIEEKKKRESQVGRILYHGW